MKGLVATLTGSPGRFSRNLLDTFNWNEVDGTGIFVYASKKSIYFAKLIEDGRSICPNATTKYSVKFLNYFKVHDEPIIAISSIHEGEYVELNDMLVQPNLVTCDNDRIFRIWSFNGLNKCLCLQEFNMRNSSSFTTTTCIGVVKGKIIVAGCVKGNGLLWKYGQDNELKTFPIEKNEIQIVKVREEFVAFGSKSGWIYVYIVSDIDSFMRTHSFKAHESDVCDLEWHPNFDLGEGEIVSSGKDRFVKIWSLEENEIINSFELPTWSNRASSAGFSTNIEFTPNYSTVCWSSVRGSTDPQLVFSTGFGLLGIVLYNKENEIFYFKANLGAKNHNRAVCGIKSFPGRSDLLVSYSVDQLINVSSVKETGGQYEVSIPCVGGAVYCLAASRINNMLAIGGSDSLLRLMRYAEGESGSSMYGEITSIWSGINGQLNSLAWHPTKKGLLAFGTDNGQVGFVNLNLERRQPVISEKFHNSKVYRVQWAMDLVNMNNQNYCVYSAGNYAVFCHHFKDTVVSFDVSHFLGSRLSKITEFAFHSSMQCIVVGHANGLVRVLSLKILTFLYEICCIRTHSKSISCLLWRPNDFRLAIASNEYFVTVSDVTELVLNPGHNSPEIRDSLALLNGHRDRVKSLDWSVHDSDRLVSVSYDNTAFVWSVEQEEPVVSFCGHQGKLFSVQWSVKCPDIVYTAGDDANMFGWCVSHQTLPLFFHRRRLVNHSNLEALVAGDNFSMHNAPSPIAPDIQQHIEALPNNKRDSMFPTTFFYEYYSAEALQYSLAAFANRSNCHHNQILDCMRLYCDRSSIVEVCNRELQYNIEKNNKSNYFVILFWIGRVDLIIKQSVILNYHPDWMNSLVFANSSKNIDLTYLKTVVHSTLVNESDPILAATFYVAFSRIHDAIQLLIRENLHREALLLAKLRLNENNEDNKALIRQILVLLKETNYKNGCYELAAAACCGFSDINDCLSIVRKRYSDSTLLPQWCSLQISHFCFHTDEMTYKLLCNFICDFCASQTKDDSQPWIELIQLEMTSMACFLVIHDMFQWVEQSNENIVELSIGAITEHKADDNWPNFITQVRETSRTKQINRDKKNQLMLYLVIEMLLALNDDEDVGESDIIQELIGYICETDVGPDISHFLSDLVIID